MKRINYKTVNLLKDILSPEGNFVELLSCDEYTVWYLMRQLGIQSYLAVYGTRSFLQSDALENLTSFGLYDEANVKVLLLNLERFFYVVSVNYQKEEQDIEAFIKKAVDQGRFVYTYYDHFYNSFYPLESIHDYHGHPITGYDDQERLYYSLFEGEHIVKYGDMEKMMLHCNEKFGTLQNRFFYMEQKVITIQPIFDDKLKREIINDLKKTLIDWQAEIDTFKKYTDNLRSLYRCFVMDKPQFLLNQRLLFNSMMEGLHYNLILKLRLTEEVFGCKLNELQEDFIKNRKESILIANMYRKLYILIQEQYENEEQYILKIKEKIEFVFIEESSKLLERMKKGIKEVLETYEY